MTVKVKGLCRTYTAEAGVIRAVDDLSFEAQPGELVVIHGASGSGKSTLLNLIAGLDDADSGVVEVGDHDVTSMDEAGRARLRLETVGVVRQSCDFIDEFTVVENVALPLEAQGAGQRDALVEARRQLARVGLEGLQNRFPRQMSVGQRQRVGIARALAGGRSILLVDEPTGALDSKASRELFALVRELCDEGAVAVVCSHDPGCRAFADTAYEMVDGRLHFSAAASSARVGA